MKKSRDDFVVFVAPIRHFLFNRPSFSSSLTTTLLHFFIPTKTMYVPSPSLPTPSLTTVSRTTSTQQKGTEQASGREMGDHAASMAGDTVSLSLRRRRGEDTSQLELTSI